MGSEGQQLAAALDTPDGPVHAYALFAHCFTCGKDGLAAKRIAVALYFKSLGHEEWFYYYLSCVILLSLIIYSTMRDTKNESAMHRHE